MSGFAEVTITAMYHPQEELFSVLDYKIFHLVCIQGWFGSIVVGVFESAEAARAFKIKLINHMHRMQSYIDDNIELIEKITSDIGYMRKLDYNIRRIRKKDYKTSKEYEDDLKKLFKEFFDTINDTDNICLHSYPLFLPLLPAFASARQILGI